MAESIVLKSDPTGSGRLLLDLLDMTSVVTANVQVEKVKGESGDKSKQNTGHQDTKLANGISLGTNYRVYGIHKVATLAGEIVQLVHLRCGDSTSYVGTWAPGSSDWDDVDPEEKERIGAREKSVPGMEGEFWMPYMDFIKTFTHLEVVHLDSETARDEPSMASKRRWSMRYYSGAWQRGVTAGGCRNNSGEPGHSLLISVWDTRAHTNDGWQNVSHSTSCRSCYTFCTEHGLIKYKTDTESLSLWQPQRNTKS